MNFKNFLTKTIVFVLLLQLLPTSFISVPQTQAAGIDSNTVLMLHNDVDYSSFDSNEDFADSSWTNGWTDISVSPSNVSLDTGRLKTNIPA